MKNKKNVYVICLYQSLMLKMFIHLYYYKVAADIVVERLGRSKAENRN